jgi:hypothetical protein
MKCTPLLGASLLGFVSTLFCARFMVWEVFLLKNISKDWLGFLPLLRRVSHDTSCVIVHGVFSLRSWLLQQIVYGVTTIVYGSCKMIKLE